MRTKRGGRAVLKERWQLQRNGTHVAEALRLMSGLPIETGKGMGGVMDPEPAPTDRASDLEACSAPRYCDVAFPPYRFVPGRNPHPTAHPEGHSYVPPGASHPRVDYVPPERWHESVDYLYGCDLYNHAYWWEAHEAWEGLWQLTDKKGCQGLFLQGLIQASACHLKLFLGHMRGVARLRDSAVRNLRAGTRDLDVGPYMGLDYEAFLSRFARYYVSDDGTKRTRHDLAIFPYVLLRRVP